MLNLSGNLFCNFIFEQNSCHSITDERKRLMKTVEKWLKKQMVDSKHNTIENYFNKG